MNLILALVFIVSSAAGSTKNQQDISIYIVEPGDTLFKIAEDYYGDGKRWKEIKDFNHLHGTNIEVNQKLKVPGKKLNYKKICYQAALKRITTRTKHAKDYTFTGLSPKEKVKTQEYRERLAYVIATQVYYFQNIIKKELTPITKLNYCLAAVATAEQESNFRFSIGPVGEIGIWQFRLSTARYVHIKNLQDGAITDRQLVELMLDPEISVLYFYFYFHELYERHGTFEMAWTRYNGQGEAARAYSRKIMKRYKEIKKLAH